MKFWVQENMKMKVERNGEYGVYESVEYRVFERVKGRDDGMLSLYITLGLKVTKIEL